MFKTRAQTLQIWELIDPDQPDQEGDIIKFPKVPLKDDYKEDGQTGPLTSTQWQHFNEAKADYFTLKEIAQEQQKGYLVMQSLFDSSIEKKLLRPTLKYQTLRQKLRILHDDIKPNLMEVYSVLDAELKKLKRTPLGQNVSEYLGKWLDVYYTAGEQSIESSGWHSYSDNGMCENVLRALQPLYTEMVITQLIELRHDDHLSGHSGKAPRDNTLPAKIKNWKTFLARSGVEKFPTKASKPFG